MAAGSKEIPVDGTPDMQASQGWANKARIETPIVSKSASST